MVKKYFSFRWDIDHRACMTDGVPNIQAVCRDLDVRNTFFVNMGRSTNVREWLGKGFRGSRKKLNDMEAINLLDKIGVRRFIIESLWPRPVGRSFIGPLKMLQADGHELGLHGGSDHVVWSRRFHELPESFLRQDVTTTLQDFTWHFGQPAGFTSPGFKSDERIMRLVSELGFAYHGDQIGGLPHKTAVNGTAYAHWCVPVTLCGPRTIPWLEWHAARGTPKQQVLEEFRKKIRHESVVVMYGHPCHEGLDADFLRALFETVRNHGFEFVTHAELINRVQPAQATETAA